MVRVRFTKLSKIYKLSSYYRRGQYVIPAVRNLNLEVKSGESLGLVGPNGSGKSTILRLIAGITTPTSGSLFVKGRVSALLELGTGFQPEFTGRENIFLNGIVLGMTKAEVTKKFNSIVKYAGVKKYLDAPIKYYSLGMRSRLGFSIAVHMNPDIFLVDEALVVGDKDFQKLGLKTIIDFRKQGKTMIIASHDQAVINQLCSRVLSLKKCRIITRS